MRNDNHSQALSEAGRANYEKIFGKKTRRIKSGMYLCRNGKLVKAKAGEIREADNRNLQSASLGVPDKSQWPEKVKKIEQATGVKVKFNPHSRAMVFQNRQDQLKVAKFHGLVVD